MKYISIESNNPNFFGYRQLAVLAVWRKWNLGIQYILAVL